MTKDDSYNNTSNNTSAEYSGGKKSKNATGMAILPAGYRGPTIIRKLPQGSGTNKIIKIIEDARRTAACTTVPPCSRVVPCVPSPPPLCPAPCIRPCMPMYPPPFRPFCYPPYPPPCRPMGLPSCSPTMMPPCPSRYPPLCIPSGLSPCIPQCPPPRFCFPRPIHPCMQPCPPMCSTPAPVILMPPGAQGPRISCPPPIHGTFKCPTAPAPVVCGGTVGADKNPYYNNCNFYCADSNNNSKQMQPNRRYEPEASCLSLPRSCSPDSSAQEENQQRNPPTRNMLNTWKNEIRNETANDSTYPQYSGKRRPPRYPSYTPKTRTPFSCTNTRQTRTPADFLQSYPNTRGREIDNDKNGKNQTIYIKTCPDKCPSTTPRPQPLLPQIPQQPTTFTCKKVPSHKEINNNCKQCMEKYIDEQLRRRLKKMCVPVPINPSCCCEKDKKPECVPVGDCCEIIPCCCEPQTAEPPKPPPEPKPEPKPEIKPEPKPEIKPEPKPEIKPEPKPETKSENVQFPPIPVVVPVKKADASVNAVAVKSNAAVNTDMIPVVEKRSRPSSPCEKLVIGSLDISTNTNINNVETFHTQTACVPQEVKATSAICIPQPQMQQAAVATSVVCVTPQPPPPPQPPQHPTCYMKPSFSKIDRVVVQKNSLEDVRQRHVTVFRHHVPHHFIPLPTVPCPVNPTAGATGETTATNFQNQPPSPQQRGMKRTLPNN